MGPVLIPASACPAGSGVEGSALQVPLAPCCHCAPQALKQLCLDGEQQAKVPAAHGKGAGRL